MAGNIYDDALEELEPPPAPSKNRYDDLLKQDDTAGQVALRQSFKQATPIEPDHAAKVQTLSQSTGLPADVVERNYEDLKSRSAVADRPYALMQKQTPALAEWASKPANAAVSHDDMEPLGALEWLLKAPSRAVAQTLNAQGYGALRTKSLFGDLTPEEVDLMNSYKLHMQDGGQLGTEGHWFRGAMTGGIKLATMLASTMPVYGLGGAAAGGLIGSIAGPEGTIAGAKLGFDAGNLYGLGKMAFQTEAGAAYDQYLDIKDNLGQPIDPKVARMAALATGAINAALMTGGGAVLKASIGPAVEKLGSGFVRDAVSKALAVPSVRAALLDAAKTYGTSLTEGTALMVGMKAVNILGGEIAKQADTAQSGRQFETASPSDVFTKLLTAAQEGAQSFALAAAVGPSLSFAHDVARSVRAKDAPAFFNALAEGVAQSKTAQRLPDTASDFIDQATKDGPIATVYAPIESWTNYWQSQGVDPAEVAERVLGSRDAYEHAVRSGEDLAIPTSRYATQLAATPHNTFFANELRLGPDEMNGREAAAMEEQIKAMKAPEEAPVSPVRQAVLDKLTNAGVPPETATHYAALFESTIGNLAERSGVDAQQLFEQYGLKVEREGMPAEGAPDAAEPSTPKPDQARLTDADPSLYKGTERRVAPDANYAGGERRMTMPTGKPASVTDAEWTALQARGQAANTKAKAILDAREAATKAGVAQAHAEAGVKVDKTQAAAQNPEEYFNVEGRRTAQEGDGPGHGEGERSDTDAGRPVEGTGDAGGHEPGRLRSAPLPGADEIFVRQPKEAAEARLTPEVRRELERIVDELETFPFVDRTFTELERGAAGKGNAGHFDIVAGNAQTDTYKDIQAFAPYNEGKGKRKGQAAKHVEDNGQAILNAARTLMKTGDVHNNLAEGALRVAENRAAQDYMHLSPPSLPAKWGREIPEGFEDALSAAIDAGLNPSADMLDQDAFRNEDSIVDPNAPVDTSFNIDEFNQSLFDDIEQPDPNVDTLATGEAQPRLPGAEDVRNQDKATPEVADLPFALTSEIAKPRAGKNRTLFQTVYHGTPHVFDKFELHAIGSGEGNQSYGWGLYFTSTKAIAEHYRENLSSPNNEVEVKIEGRETDRVPSWLGNELKAGNFDEVIKDFTDRIAEAEARRAESAQPHMVDEQVRNQRRILATAEAAKAAGAEGVSIGQLGRVLTVEIPDDENMLDYDKPASQQSPKVQEALKALGVTWEALKIPSTKQAMRTFNSDRVAALAREDIGIREALQEGLYYATQGNESAFAAWYGKHQGLMREAGMIDPTGQQIYERVQMAENLKNRKLTLQQSAEAASRALNAVGVHGIRYLDGNSRIAGEGTHNYVVFDDKLAQIKEFSQSPAELTQESVAAWAEELKQRVGPDLNDLKVYLAADGSLRLEVLAVARGAQRAGLGSDVMRELTRFADLNGRAISLTPAKRGYLGSTTSKSRLIKFYERFGFVQDGPDLVREPTLPTPGAAGGRAPQTETPAFRTWFGGSKVVDDNGKPLVVYHGTTADFTSFDREKTNPEADFGRGFYFSNNPDDTEANYAGIGPDLENKIQQLAERLASEQDKDYNDPEIVKEARAKYVEHEGASMPVFLKMENPAILGGPDATRLDYETVEEDGDVVDEKGSLVDFIVALRDVASRYDDGSVDDAINELVNLGMDGGITLGGAINVLRDTETFNYYTDGEGTLASHEIIRETLERMGFDGVIDRTVNDKFGSGRMVGKQMSGMDEDTVHYVAFEPNQVKSAIGNKGTFNEHSSNILEQEKRGAIRFGADRQMTIKLLERADLSTFLHESGHFFLEVFGDIADKLTAVDPSTLTDAQRAMLSDYGQLFAHLGIENRDQLGEAQHEQFARSFEAYLMEGKAPSLELQGTFARFRAWLVGIYRSLTNLHVDLTPQVRGILDRMVASDRAIQDAEAQRGVVAMFTAPEDAGMTPAEFGLYRKTVEDASRKAREELDAKLFADVQREQTAQWKAQRAEVKGKVEDDFYSRPEYRAIAAMTRGTHPNGDPLVEGMETAPLKLDAGIIKERYGPERAKRLPRGIVAKGDGVDPETVARMFGFNGGDAMLTAVEKAPAMRGAIDQEVKRQMFERNGNTLLDGTLHDKAQAAVANEDRDLVIRAELRALGQLRRTVGPFVAEAKRGEQANASYERRWLEAEAKLRIAIAEGHKQVEIDKLQAEVSDLKAQARGGAAAIRAAMPPAGVLKQAAEDRINALRIGSIQPQAFWSASRRSAQMAIDRAARQDFDGAIQAKQQELISVNLYRRAEAALEAVDAGVRFAKGLTSTAARQRIGKAGGTYLDQIDGILDRFEFAKVPEAVLDRRASLRNWAESLVAQGLPADQLPEDLLAEASRKNYKDMTLEEFTGVVDGLRQIEHLAALKNRLLKAEDARDFAEVRDGAVGSILDNNERRPKKLEFTPADERWRAVAGWFAAHKKIGVIAQALDGYEDGGAFWTAFMKPINEASDAEATRRAAAAEDYFEIIEEHYPGGELRRLQDKLDIPGVGSLSKEARLALAMNWGNQTSRDRVLADPQRGWSRDQVNAILDTLDKRDWEFVQSTFDYIDRFWPEIAAKQERVTGIAPEKVEALPIETKFGSYAGGYYPLQYDSRFSPRVAANELASKAKLETSAAYVRTTTKRGHVEARKSNVKLPLRLDLSVVHNHVDQVLHDLTHHEALIDVTRLLRDPKVSKAIIETQGDPIYHALTTALQDIALGSSGGPRNAMDKAATYMRTGVQLSQLGFNLWTGLKVPEGIFNGAARVGPEWIARGAYRWLRDAATMTNTLNWITDVSPMMKERGASLSQDVSDLRTAFREPGGWFDGIVRKVTNDHLSVEAITDAAVYHIGLAYRLVEVPTWLGQYEKSMAAGETEERAFRIADQAVLDTHGGGNIKDLSGVQRGGPIAKLFMMFYTYGSTVYNATAREFGMVNPKSPASIGTFLGHLGLLYIAPAMVSVGLKTALGKDNSKKFFQNVGRESVAIALNTMVLVRELGGLIEEGNRGYGGPAGTRLFEMIDRLGTEIKQGKVDEGLKKAVAEVGGALLHIPGATQIERTIDGWIALEEGRTKNPAALIVGPPPKNQEK